MPAIRIDHASWNFGRLCLLALLLLGSGSCGMEPARRVGGGLPPSQNTDTTVAGTAYSAIVATAVPGLELVSGEMRLPLMSLGPFTVWDSGWNHLCDEVGPGAIRRIAADTVMTRCQGNSPRFILDGRREYHPDRINCLFRLSAVGPEPDCRRVAIELGPAWRAVAGAQVEALMADGSTRSLDLPREDTPQGAYKTLLEGDVDRLRLTGVYGIADAGCEIFGPLHVQLEQTGQRFRWHLGARGLPRPLGGGEAVQVEFSLRPLLPARGIPASRAEATIAIDAGAMGPQVSPMLFGANLHKIGHGILARGMRHPYQHDPSHDAEAARCMLESGVSFFRVYIQHLFDTLGQCGGDTSSDPIAPALGAPCDYTRADSFIAGIRRLGIELMPCVGLYCPPWLSSDRPSPKHRGMWMTHRSPPRDNRVWAGIVAGLVRHWNLEQGFQVRLWQVGNEPDNWTRYWVGGTLPEFIDYFNTAARAMKAVDPSIAISGPDLAQITATAWPDHRERWLDGFLAGCRDTVEDFSFNCYHTDDFAGPVATARTALATAGIPDRPLSIAEYHLTAGNDDPAVYTFDGALYLCRALRSLMQQRVERASFFCWNEGGALDLLDARPDGTLAPRPTYHAFRMHAALGRFKGATLLPVTVDSPHISVNACRHADGRGISAVLAVDAPELSSIGLKIRLDQIPEGASATVQILLPGHEIEDLPDGRFKRGAGSLTMEVPGRAIVLIVMRW